MNVDIPLYVAKFVDSDRLIVGGGGGEGHHGLKNLLAVVTQEPVAVTLSKELRQDEDAPTTISYVGNSLYLGINVALTTRQGGSNRHLRVLDPVTLEETAAYDLFQSAAEDDDVYQRASAGQGEYLAIASGGGFVANPKVVVAKACELPKTLWSTEVSEPVNDLAIALDASKLAICTNASILVYDMSTGKKLHEIPAKTGPKWVRVKFISSSRLIAASQERDRKKHRAELVVLELAEAATEVRRERVAGAKAISALDATPEHVAVATPSGDILIYSHRLATLARIKAAHTLPVTSITIDTEDSVVASVSIAGTVHFARIPSHASADWLSAATFGWLAASGVVVGIIALALFVLAGKYLDQLSGVESHLSKLSPFGFKGLKASESPSPTETDGVAGTIAYDGDQQVNTEKFLGADATAEVVSTVVEAEETPSGVEAESEYTPEPADDAELPVDTSREDL